MANTNLKPKEARFAQIFFFSNYEIGDRAEMEVFNITVIPEKVIYHRTDLMTPPVNQFEEMEDDMVRITTEHTHYICYKGHSIDEKYICATISEIPSVGKGIEIMGHNRGTEYEGIYRSIVTPEEVNERFAEYDMYIFKANGKIYLCYLR